MAIKVHNKIITGKQTKLLTPPSSAILNAIKYLSKIPDDIDLLSPNVLLWSIIVVLKHVSLTALHFLFNTTSYSTTSPSLNLISLLSFDSMYCSAVILITICTAGLWT